MKVTGMVEPIGSQLSSLDTIRVQPRAVTVKAMEKNTEEQMAFQEFINFTMAITDLFDHEFSEQQFSKTHSQN